MDHLLSKEKKTNYEKAVNLGYIMFSFEGPIKETQGKIFEK